ncbi:Putative nucleic acid-binding protein (fragment) [Agrobacterium fabacearum S56]
MAGRAAFAWAYLMALAKRNGRRLASMDGSMVATAVAHPLTLATPNITDLEGFGIKISDQWVD